MSEDTELKGAVDELTARIGKLASRVDDSPDDGGRKAASMDGIVELTKRVVAAETKVEEAETASAKKAEQGRIQDIVDDAVKAALKGVRGPSAVEQIGQGKALTGEQSRMLQMSQISASPVLKAIFSDYKAGELFTGMLNRKGIGGDGEYDADLVPFGKAQLGDLGIGYQATAEKASTYITSEGRIDASDPSAGWAKATTGLTGTTGGYVLPNNLVDTVLKPSVQRAVYQNLVTVRNGVNVRGVDQPYRLGAPARMVFQDWNATKENVDETYGSYSANLGTLARIMDITVQYARFSAGAAEADVIDELTKAAILGENYYIIAGAGTGSAGTGDPTLGVYTALAATGQVAYRNAFSGASDSTIVGSAAKGFTTMLSALAARSREATAIVVDATTFWQILGQGTNEAGFFVSPDGGPTGFTRTSSGGLAFWGVPLYYDANLGTNATTKIAIGGEWSQLKLYRGMEFRIDTSTQAGTRWDKNLIGFRGEEEIAVHAGSAVNVGAFQLTTAIVA